MRSSLNSIPTVAEAAAAGDARHQRRAFKCAAEIEELSTSDRRRFEKILALYDLDVRESRGTARRVSCVGVAAHEGLSTAGSLEVNGSTIAADTATPPIGR